MKKTISLILFLFSISIATNSFAASDTRKHFLSHGPSVTAFGAGETLFAAYKDAAVIQYNPSLAAFFGESVLNISRFNLYEGDGYNSASAVFSFIKNFQIGFSISNLSSGKIALRDIDFNYYGETSANMWNYSLTGSGMIKPLGLAYGFGTKYIYFDMGEEKGGTAALDLGLSKMLKGPKILGNISKIKLALSAQNIIAGKLKVSEDEDDIPAIYGFGTAFIFPINYRFQTQDTISLYADIKYENSDYDFYGGLAYTIADKYSLKAGYYDEHLTFGFGIDFYSFTVDYAADFSDIDMIHRFGLSFRWGSEKEEEELEKEAKEALDKKKLSLKEAEKQFNEAKKFYNRGEYLRATDMLSVIVVSYPDFESPMYFYNKIKENMKKAAKSEHELDFAALTYAKGYIAYYETEYNTAWNEWGKYVHFTGGNEEIKEYMEKIDTVLKMRALAERESRLDAEAAKRLAAGIKYYNSSNWIACIKNMEALQKFVSDNKFSKTLEYYNKAKSYIMKSVNELVKLIAKSKNMTNESEEQAEMPKREIDEVSADKKYNEGLVLFAQGKYFEAERTWELTLRLNPEHKKAKIALSKLRSGGYLGE